MLQLINKMVPVVGGDENMIQKILANTNEGKFSDPYALSTGILNATQDVPMSILIFEVCVIICFFSHFFFVCVKKI